MRATSVAIAIAALFLGACGNNDIEVNKSRPISASPSTPSTVLEAMSGKEEGDQATDAASEMTKDTMDKAEEMVADADMMDKAKEMAEDSEVMDKAEAMVEDASDAEVMDKAKEMMADADMMDKAKEMAGDSDVMDSAKAMVDSDEMKEAMNDAHSMFGVSGAEEAAEEVAEAAPVAMASVSMDDGKALANKSGCFACHAIDRKVLGPAWKDVAAKYASDKAAGKTHLLNKVAKGGKGVWADAGINAAMPPYSPRVSDENIEVLVDFILGL